MQLTNEQLDALEAALAKATPGAVEMYAKPIREVRYQGVYEVSSVRKATWKALFMHEADAIAYREAHNALPALITELRALRVKTTPVVIGEEHRDGKPWQVWEPFYERWVYAHWRRAGGGMKLCTCGQPAPLLCDGRVMTLRDGTIHRIPRFGSNVPGVAKSCDAPICKACRTKVSDVHLRTDKGCQWDSINLCPLCAAANKETE